jgi:hypothetical protein
MDPRGSVGCAAVMAYISYVSPFAVGRPSKSSPYQLVLHSQIARGFLWSLGVEFGLGAGKVAGSVALSGEGLLGFPADVGLTVGVKTSRPSPKNTDCKTTKGLTFIFT